VKARFDHEAVDTILYSGAIGCYLISSRAAWSEVKSCWLDNVKIRLVCIFFLFFSTDEKNEKPLHDYGDFLNFLHYRHISWSYREAFLFPVAGF